MGRSLSELVSAMPQRTKAGMQRKNAAPNKSDRPAGLVVLHPFQPNPPSLLPPSIVTEAHNSIDTMFKHVSLYLSKRHLLECCPLVVYCNKHSMGDNTNQLVYIFYPN
jgi:hypothetical protein